MNKQVPRETVSAQVGPLRLNVIAVLPPGAISVGGMKKDDKREFDADEAIRLVEAKGFAWASETDAQLAIGHRAKTNAAATADADAAAAAEGEGGGAPATTTAE